TLSLYSEIEERRSREARIIHFAEGMRCVTHGVTGIEQQSEQSIGLTAIALQVTAFGSGEHVPIDMPQVVAGRVGAVFGKLLAETEVRGTMEPGDKAIDHSFRHQIQTGYPGQH